jgi:CTP synthase
MPFIEAMRQFQFKVGRENFCLIHVSLIPVIGAVGELKTKPTQMSVRELRALGLSPNIIACRYGVVSLSLSLVVSVVVGGTTHNGGAIRSSRSDKPLGSEVKTKISQFCHVPPEDIFGIHNVSNIFRVPLMMHSQGFTERVCYDVGNANSIIATNTCLLCCHRRYCACYICTTQMP